MCVAFRDKFPKSTLLPAVLFRHAENAYFMALAAEKIPKPAERATEVGQVDRRDDQALHGGRREVSGVHLRQHRPLRPRHGLLSQRRSRKGEGPARGDSRHAIAPATWQLCPIRSRTSSFAPPRRKPTMPSAAGRLEEAMKAAIEQLEGYVGANPTGPQTPTLISRSATAMRHGGDHRAAAGAAKGTRQLPAKPTNRC